MGEWIGVIPAAGLGTRAYPYTATIPKGLLPVDGLPLLQRNLEILRDQVGVTEVLIVIGYRGEAIEQTFGDGSNLGLKIRYVRNDRLELGLAHSIRLAGRELQGHGGPSVLLLSDECYVGSDHTRLKDLDLGGLDAACGILHTDVPGLIRRNYSVELDGSRIQHIVEKPRVLANDILGTGTYVLTPPVYKALEQAFEASARPPEWMTFLDEYIQAGGRVRAVDLAGDYTNVNSRDELNRANLLVRNHGFDRKRTSVVVVADHQPHTLADVLRRFARSEEVFELVVVSSTDLPDELASIPKVRGLTAEAGTSFGDRTRLGLDAAQGELLVLTQSDDSFSPDDLPKLLGYIRDADLVVGTRTTRQMIEQGANMRGIVRIAHLLLAKLMEQLWRGRGARFSDVGCVYRAIWKSTWDLIAPHVNADGQEIYPEMVLEILHARRRVIEVPVNYYNRDPVHEAVTSTHQTARTFLRILGMILRRSLFRRGH